MTMSNFNNFDDKENDSTFSLDNVVLEQYEKNEFMQAVINDLKQFFVFANCTCHNKREKCFKEVGFEAFLERHLEFQSLEKKQLEFVLMGQLLAFLNNYANIYGFPSPGHHMQTDSLAIILLPTEKNYTRVYEDFVTTSRELDSNISVISYKSFVRLWKSLTPHIKFMTSATDLCDVCEILKKP